MASDTTQASAATPASAKVLGDFDLMEDILLNLPLRDLLFSKRVSKSWLAIQQQSDRIQKALFLKPFSEMKIYYPDSSTPHWYLNPKGNKHLHDNLNENEDKDEDGGVSIELPKWFQNGGSGVPPADYAEQCKAYQASLSCHLANQKVSTYVSDKAMATKRKGSSRDSKQQQQQKRKKFSVYVFNSPFGEDTQDSADDSSTSTPTQQTFSRVCDDPPSNPRARASETELKPYLFSIALKQSEATDSSKLPVPRITGPYINPFCELFVERFCRGARGKYFPHKEAPPLPAAPDLLRPRREPSILCRGDLVVRADIRYPDGTTYGRSRASRAIQHYCASWRKMHPFSAVTTAVEFECFDFGDLSIFNDEGMLFGDMMEQLFRHWANDCPDCCIFEFWFSDFVKPYNINLNCGDHGVQKLPGGLNNTGWETLDKLRAGQVELTGHVDVVKGY